MDPILLEEIKGAINEVLEQSEYNGGVLTTSRAMRC